MIELKIKKWFLNELIYVWEKHFELFRIRSLLLKAFEYKDYFPNPWQNICEHIVCITGCITSVVKQFEQKQKTFLCLNFKFEFYQNYVRFKLKNDDISLLNCILTFVVLSYVLR